MDARVLYFTGRVDGAVLDMEPGEAVVRVCLLRLGLVPGQYSLEVDLTTSTAEIAAAEPVVFKVQSEKNTALCRYYQQREWKLMVGSISAQTEGGRR